MTGGEINAKWLRAPNRHLKGGETNADDSGSSKTSGTDDSPEQAKQLHQQLVTVLLTAVDRRQ